MGRIAGAALAIALVLPAGASAASTPLQVSGPQIVYAADNGEGNRIVISRQGDQFVFVDFGGGFAMADVLAPCTFIAASEARCPATGTPFGITTFSISLLDGNDEIALDTSIVPPVRNVSFFGGLGDDILTGGAGIENGLQGEEGNDTITGAERDDGISGGAGNDTLFGASGDDRITGGHGVDTMDGGEGFDSFEQEQTPDGADTMLGGPDLDSVDFNSRTGNVTVSPNDVADDGEAGEGDNVGSDIENYFLGRGNDTVMGGPGPNQIQDQGGNNDIGGGDGNDVIFTSNGDDTLRGEGGDDRIGSSTGADTVEGGVGYDYLFESFFDMQLDTYSGGPGLDTLGGGSETPITVTLDGVADDGLINPPTPAAMDNVGADMENVVGTDKGDTLIGNDSDNELSGGLGNDTLIGLGGADGLFGGDGGDTLNPGAGIDRVEGEGGADALRSRDEGPDELGCGSSLDTLFGDSFDDPSADCDQVSLGVEIASGKATVDGGKVNLKASCPQIETGGCDAFFTLSAKGKVIAKGKKEIDAGKEQKAKLKPTKAGQKKLKGKGSLKAIAGAEMTDAAGDAVSSELKVKVAL